MQWSDERNAGFSSAPADRLIRPVVSEGPFDYTRVNVASQHDRPGSIMEDLQRLIRTRRSCPEVGWGNWHIVETDETSVLALRYDWRKKRTLVLHNLADRAVEVRLTWDGVPARLIPIFCDTDDRAARGSRDPIALGPYGFLWLRVMEDGGRPGQEPKGTGHA